MHGTTKCAVLNNFYFRKSLWCMPVGFPACYDYPFIIAQKTTVRTLSDDQAEHK